MGKLAQLAADNFLNKGFSCSESVVKAAADLGMMPQELVSVATSFSGGMGSGCLCGAIAGAQIVLGYNFGKYSKAAQDLQGENAAASSAPSAVAPARALAPEGASAHVANVVPAAAASSAPSAVAPARALAKRFVEEFKKSHKATCCRVLTAGFDFHSKERKQHCVNMVQSCSEILEKMLECEKAGV